MLLPPLRLEFGWGEIAQRRMDPLVHVHVIQEAADLAICLMIVQVLGQVNLLFLDRPDETLGVAVLPGFALVSHADLDLGVLKDLSVGRGRVLDALVRMVNLWSRILDEPALQSDQSQGVVQVAPQMPPPDTSGEDVHDHRQVNEPVAQADVGDVTHPDLLRAHDLQVQNQVRVAGKIVLAVGCAPLLALDLGLDVHQTHQTLHSLVVDHPFPTSQLPGNASIAVGWPFSGRLLDRSPELGFIGRLDQLVVVAAPGHFEHLASYLDGILVREHVDHLPLPIEREVKMLEAFFATSNSMVSRPTICSRSAIRSCSSPRLRSVAKISGARSRNSSRHREKTCGLSRYSRQISALSLMPVSSSSTTWALNSGVNARRFDIVFPPLDRFYLNYRTCPVFGGHYMEQAVRAGEANGDRRDVAAFASHLATLLMNTGDLGTSHQQYQRALSMFEAADDRATCYHGLGCLAYLKGDNDEAQRLYQRSLEISEKSGNRMQVACTLHQMGLLAQEMEHYDEARRLYQRSLDIAEDLKDWAGIAQTLHQLGMLANLAENLAEAQRLYQASLNIEEELGHQEGIARALHNLGILAQTKEDYSTAQRLYRQSLGIAERLGMRMNIADSLHQLGMLAQDLGNYAEAERLYQRSLDINEALGNPTGIARDKSALGFIFVPEGETKHGLLLMDEASTIAEETGMADAHVLRELAQALGTVPGLIAEMGYYVNKKAGSMRMQREREEERAKRRTIQQAEPTRST
jgi:tetratricopeptide (TPR) repeat protein